jgi:hypothetical protein
MIHLNAATTEALVDFVQGFALNPPEKLRENQNRLAPAPKPDDTYVTLRGVRVPLTSDVGGAFVSDVSRNKERLFSDQRLCEKYGLTLNAWTAMAKNQALRLAVDAEHERRVYNGDAARESAALLFSKAPHTIAEILNDKSASPKHRIDAARELRATANVGAEKAGDDSDRFVITINLGGDEKLVFDKQIAPLTPEEARKDLDAE